MSDKPFLRTFMPALGLPDPSPFPTKVMMFMRMHEIDFDKESGDVRTAPLGKIPFLEHKGRQIPDSELILDYLEKTFDIAKDDLTPEQHAMGHMLCRALEERLYWIIAYSRWMDDDNFAVLREEFFGSIPALLRGLISNKIRKDMKKTMHGQGLGRHTEETMYEFARRDVEALSAFLGDKPFLFGDQPTRYDCTAAAFAGQVLQTELPTPFMGISEAFPNLADYWQRAKSRYFSDN